jgi:hypothetical protein
MNDAAPLPVAELDPPASGRAGRALPFLWVVVGVLLIAAVVGAVVAGGDDRSPAERVAAAPDAVKDAGTFAFQITAETAIASTKNTVTIDGQVDAATKRSKAKLSLLGNDVETVTDGTFLYLHLPEVARPAGGKSWIKVDAAALAPGLGGGGIGTSPLQTFDELRAKGQVTEVGKEEVRGEDTTHFRTVLDLTAQLDKIPAGSGIDADAMRKQLAAVPVDVWLDGKDRIRRERVVLHLDLPLGGALPGASGFDVTTTVEAFDYGKDVTIDLPPADDVTTTDAAGLGSLFGGASAVAPAPAD